MIKHVSFIYFTLLISSIFLYSCSQPFDSVKNRTWEGQIYRNNDNKQLSDVRLKMSNDTLYLFSNAIFGSESDTLILQNFEKKDSTFTYKSEYGNSYSFKLIHELNVKSENLYFMGDDYYIVLQVSSLDISEEGALDFYKYSFVPRESYMYLDGAYEGELEMENQLANLYMAEMGGFKMKLVFIDDFKVKMYLKNPLINMFSGSGAPNYEIVNYKIIDNKLYLLNSKAKARTIEVRNYGETLVLATDDANIVLHKIY